MPALNVMTDLSSDLPKYLTAGSAVARVYVHVRDGIVSGAYRWGEKLGEAALASKLGVSRTPVREALRNLAADGYIEVRLNAGAVVRTWNIDEVRSSFDIRAEIEGQAAAYAAERISEAAIARLEDLCERMEAAQDAAERSSYNRLLHLSILRISGIPHAEKITMQLSELAVLTMTYKKFSQSETERSNSDHRLLMRALRLNDAKLAQAVMRAHILTAAAVLDEEQFNLR